jgi:hypothetical protein
VVKKFLTLISGVLLSSSLLALSAAPAAFSKNPDQETQTDKPQSSKAVVRSKPEPHCPKNASEQEVRATIVLRAIFRSTGKVTDLKFAGVTPSDVPDDIVKRLSEESLRVAAKIKFQPATKDGHPVSMYVQLEYSFTCY